LFLFSIIFFIQSSLLLLYLDEKSSQKEKRTKQDYGFIIKVLSAL